jgi:hypothetical protein
MKIKEIFVLKKEYEERLTICTECEHFKKFLNRCGICGCVMTIKARLQNMSCPKNKWNQENKNALPE